VAILTPFNIDDETLDLDGGVALVQDVVMSGSALTLNGGITDGFINALAPLTIRVILSRKRCLGRPIPTLASNLELSVSF
jgi:hypothetical protein